MKYEDIPILMYHEISDLSHECCISPNKFKEQMLFLKENGYHTITLNQLKDGIEQGLETDKKLVVLTFDDGRSGVYDHAFPLIREFGFNATIFVIPGWIEFPETMPESENYSGVCSWEQLKEISAAGFEIGSHTFSHPDLSSLKLNDVLLEISSAERIINLKMNLPVNSFCYPYGKYNSSILEVVKKRYPSAVSVKKGFEKCPGEFSRQWITNNMNMDDFFQLLKRQTISLCMIVKDEEDNLEKCLIGVKNLVDEIIIVDTGSTDRTKEIAQIFTDKILDFKWNDDFSEARNESLKHAESDWILILDADEFISEKDFSSIRETINNHQFSAFQLMTRNYSNDSSISGWTPSDNKIAQGWYPSLKVRIFKNNQGFKFQGKIHEIIDVDIKEKQGNISLLSIPIHHYGTLNTSSKKTKKYLGLTKEKISLNPKDAKAYCELGIQQKLLNKFAEAEQSFLQSLNLDPLPLTPLLNLALVQQKQDKIEIAIKNYHKVLQKDSKHSEAYFGLGFCYFRQNNILKALDYFLMTIRYNPSYLDAYINAGALYEKKKDFTNAETILCQVLKISPHNGRAYHNLGVVFEKQMKLEAAVRCYKLAIKYDYAKKDQLLERITKINKFIKENSIKEVISGENNFSGSFS